MYVKYKLKLKAAHLDLGADLVPLYPESITPQALLDVQKFYIDKYQDRLFISPP
jgi:hypothetical protein